MRPAFPAVLLTASLLAACAPLGGGPGGGMGGMGGGFGRM